MKIKWYSLLVAMGMMPFFAMNGSAQDCQKATELVIEAYDLGWSLEVFPEQKQLLHQALQLCPEHPEAHNNLASILEEKEDYAQALKHYKEAVRFKPDFPEAWFGVGEVYFKTERFALALASYLKACHDKDARHRIEDLLVSNQYRSAEAGDVLDQESLSLLFDPQRRDAINQKLKACGFNMIVRGDQKVRAYMEPVVIFRNILFDLGQVSLKPESIPQLREIGAALQRLSGVEVIISGHTDIQPFKGHSQEESDRLNMQLSKDRAATVAEFLASSGILLSRISTYGYGPTRPVVEEHTEEAFRQNRRVEIEVEKH